MAAYFNSRPREGANMGRHSEQRGHLLISIPAPARGRTHADLPALPKFMHFNSRPREGANSWSLVALFWFSYFNSRPREGANRQGSDDPGEERISIPAPARGRTKSPAGAILTSDFNSRPREGANIWLRASGLSCT